MSDQFLGEIRPFANNFAPYGWAQCNGQILPISQNAALFALLGTAYGGNGTSNFGLPNIAGCRLYGQGQGLGLQPYAMGETGGEDGITLLQSEIPNHTHTFNADSAGPLVEKNSATTAPVNNVSFLTNGIAKPAAGGTPANNGFASSGAPATMSPQMISTVGGSQPHENRQPFLVINYCIALQGVFPTRQ